MNASIYRVANQAVSSTGVFSKDAGGPAPMGPGVERGIPGNKESIRFWETYRPIIRHNNEIFQESKFLFVDTAVFRVFGFPLINGNPSSVFSTPNSVVISHRSPRKYFQDKDPDRQGACIQRLSGGGEIPFTVTGVFKDLPTNTALQFQFSCVFQGDRKTQTR
ncbi:MAG: ABC transporter permease [Bacteroidota bacterium]